MWEQIIERIMNKETLYALIVGGTTLGLWQLAPEKVELLTAFLVGVWTLFKLYQKEEE